MTTSDAVWSEQGTTPDRIEAALRELLAERHAESGSYVPARVLNMIVFVDDEWSGEIANRLRGVGRYAASRLVVLSYEPKRERLDASASVASDAEPAPGELALLRETVIVRLGERHLDDLDTIADPLVVTDLPTLLWSPHGHPEAVDALLSLAQATLIDSIDEPVWRDALARASTLARQLYVVDLAWLRSTPWRERVAATFDPPAMRAELGQLDSVTVRHHPDSTVAAMLLLGWLASRLDWKLGHAEIVGGDRREGALGGTARADGRDVRLELRADMSSQRSRPRRARDEQRIGLRAGSRSRSRRPARAPPRRRRARARVDAAWRLARRERHPRRGYPPSPAARPNVRTGARGGAGDAARRADARA